MSFTQSGKPEYLYHFFFTLIFQNNNLNPIEHIGEVLQSGYLLCKRLHTEKRRTAKVKSDPPTEDNYVFLTSRRNFMQEAFDHIRVSKWARRNTFKEVIYGLQFSTADIRNDESSWLRHWNHRMLNMEFSELQDQQILPEDEVMVFGGLDLSLVTGYIINNVMLTCAEMKAKYPICMIGV